MGQRALFICFIPAVIAGLFMGLFINYFPDFASWKGSGVNASVNGTNATKQLGSELNAVFTEDSSDWLIALVFIVMILGVLRVAFGVRWMYLVSALFSYMGMILLVSGTAFIGLMYLFFGGFLSLFSSD